MMKFLGLTCVLVHLLLQVKGQTWNEFEGHCYTVLNVKNNFETSKKDCVSYGASIVELGTMPELEFVRTLINGSNDQFWMGLEFNNVTSKFFWDRDGQEPMVDMWLPGEPNLSGTCVRLATESQVGLTPGGNTFLLGDHYCSNSYRVVCEKNTESGPGSDTYQQVAVTPTNRCPMKTFKSRSSVNCTRNCSEDKFCIGFQYNNEIRTCTLYKFSTTCATHLVSPLILNVRQFVRC